MYAFKYENKIIALSNYFNRIAFNDSHVMVDFTDTFVSNIRCLKKSYLSQFIFP